MTEQQFQKVASQLARIDERTKSIKDQLEKGTKRFENHEKRFDNHDQRLKLIERTQSVQELQLKITRWLAATWTVIGLGALVRWIMEKH